MIASPDHRQTLKRAAAGLVLLAFGVGLSGCADLSDSMTAAFADPARYELYDCKQLQAERERLATRGAELQGLMAKADTGAAGPVIAELAYRNDYVAIRGQSRLAEEAWRRNKCHEAVPGAAAPAAPPAANVRAAPPPSRSGSAVY